MGEADLEHHFSNPSNATAVKKREDLVMREKPSMSSKYLKESEKEKVAKQEEDRIAGAIGALGIDWSKGEPAKNPQLTGTLKPGSDKKIAAGETVQLEVTAENKGTEPLKRLRAWTESENAWLDRREFLFG